MDLMMQQPVKTLERILPEVALRHGKNERVKGISDHVVLKVGFLCINYQQ